MALNDTPPVLETCSTCRHRSESAFCNLSREALQALDQISFSFPYPQRAILFNENQPCRGAFILCSGQAKLSTSARSGKTLLLRTAEAGEVLGLSSVFSGRCYELTAEIASVTAAVRFVKREDFVDYLHKFGESNLRAIQALGREYEHALENLRTLAWLSTATARVAQLLLQTNDGNGGRLMLTQEQIAQKTATTRETVTRLLLQLRKERIISLEGSDLLIRNRAALEKMAS
jgi:CRP/FNR family transcriptional regulator, cyclic AMP receptor protein